MNINVDEPWSSRRRYSSRFVSHQGDAERFNSLKNEELKSVSLRKKMIPLLKQIRIENISKEIDTSLKEYILKFSESLINVDNDILKENIKKIQKEVINGLNIIKRMKK